MRAVSIVVLLFLFSSIAVIAQSPGTRFVVTGGEAYDKKTGLIWQRCMVAVYGATASAQGSRAI